MKKTLKKILIFVAIIYLICSLFYSVYLKGVYTEQVNAILENTNEEMVIVGDVGRERYDWLGEYYSKIQIIDINLILMVVALVVGGIIGLVMSLKENSKTKYILYFILGNIIFNLIFTIMSIIIYNKINTFVNLEFLKTYINTTIKTIIPYIFVYILILYAQISNNKQKVDNLNASLNNEKILKEFELNKKVILIISIIVVIIGIIIIGVVGKRAIILIRYSKAVNELVNTQNYYIKTTKIFESIEDGKHINIDESISEYYYKNGKSIEKDYKDNVLNSTTYMDDKEMVIITKDYTIVKERDKYDFEKKGIYNNYYGDTYPRVWQNIALAFKVDIKKVEYNGKSCYKIERKDNDIVYINSKTFEPVGITNITIYNRYGDNVVEAKSIMKQTYEIKKDHVKEEIQRPNLEGVKTYTLEELNKKYNNIES